MVAEIGNFWKLDPLAAYLPNLKDGLYPVVRPTGEELAITFEHTGTARCAVCKKEWTGT